VARPEQVDVWVGLDVGKEDHFAEVLDHAGERIFARGVANDEAALVALLDRAGQYGIAGLVIDQPGSIAQLTLAVAARRQVPVAYVPGLVTRRAADLYPGEAKTDKRDAFIIADTGRTRRRQVHWLDAGSDELRVLNGFDIDLAADQTRLANRLRDALTSVSPALERALGKRLAQAGCGTCWPATRPRPPCGTRAAPGSWTGSSPAAMRWPLRSRRCSSRTLSVSCSRPCRDRAADRIQNPGRDRRRHPLR
jgi:Transposase